MAKTVQFKVPSQPNSLQTYSFPNGFAGGMNISVAGDQLVPNQSPSMQDVNYDGWGVPTKRYGFNKVYSINLGNSPIRHMVEFAKIGASTEFLIVHGGNIFKEVN